MNEASRVAVLGWPGATGKQMKVCKLEKDFEGAKTVTDVGKGGPSV